MDLPFFCLHHIALDFTNQPQILSVACFHFIVASIQEAPFLDSDQTKFCTTLLLALADDWIRTLFFFTDILKHIVIYLKVQIS